MASENVTRRRAASREERWRALGQAGATVWFTGLPAAGKSTLAHRVEAMLLAAGRSAYVLDGDNLRRGLCTDLGYDPESRDENVRRAAEVARMFADAGTIALVALISPYARERRRARELHEDSGLTFLEVYVNTPLQECESRDPKGLYRGARAGAVDEMTGVSAPYEPPADPDLEMTPELGVERAAEIVIRALTERVDGARP